MTGKDDFKRIEIEGTAHAALLEELEDLRTYANTPSLVLSRAEKLEVVCQWLENLAKNTRNRLKE